MLSIPLLFFGLSDFNKFRTTFSLTVFKSNFKFVPFSFSFSLANGSISGSLITLAANFSTFSLKKNTESIGYLLWVFNHLVLSLDLIEVLATNMYLHKEKNSIHRPLSSKVNNKALAPLRSKLIRNLDEP